MKIKYKLTYEWEDNEVDITAYAEDNGTSIEEAIKQLTAWNRENVVERLDYHAANILSIGANFKFEYEYEYEEES